MSQVITNKDLWSDDACKRLDTAKKLSMESIEAQQAYLCSGCPVAVWPYGMPTSINPFLVTLGMSPGAPPPRGHPQHGVREPYKLPPAGRAHDGVHFDADYYRRIRVLSDVLVADPFGLSKDEGYALFGNMNLDIGAYGSSENVDINPTLASWVLETITKKLRPRFLICLGFIGALKKPTQIKDLFESTFSDMKINRPHRTVEFDAYKVKDLSFREWDLSLPDGHRTTLVLWPQHPSRSPFKSNPEMWMMSVSEFAERHLKSR